MSAFYTCCTKKQEWCWLLSRGNDPDSLCLCLRHPVTCSRDDRLQTIQQYSNQRFPNTSLICWFTRINVVRFCLKASYSLCSRGSTVSNVSGPCCPQAVRHKLRQIRSAPHASCFFMSMVLWTLYALWFVIPRRRPKDPSWWAPRSSRGVTEGMGCDECAPF